MRTKRAGVPIRGYRRTPGPLDSLRLEAYQHRLGFVVLPKGRCFAELLDPERSHLPKYLILELRAAAMEAPQGEVEAARTMLTEVHVVEANAPTLELCLDDSQVL